MSARPPIDKGQLVSFVTFLDALSRRVVEERPALEQKLSNARGQIALTETSEAWKRNDVTSALLALEWSAFSETKLAEIRAFLNDLVKGT